MCIEALHKEEGQPQFPVNTANPANINYHYHVSPNCNCGCSDIVKRVDALEKIIVQLNSKIDEKQDIVRRKYI